MVKETRIIIGLEDIINLRFQCKKCAGVVAVKLNARELMPPECPLCTNRWQVNGGIAASILTELRHLLRQETTVQILFEIDAEPEKK